MLSSTNLKFNRVDLLIKLIAEFYNKQDHRQVVELSKLVLHYYENTNNNKIAQIIDVMHYLSISAFYCGEIDLGREANDILLFCNDRNLHNMAVQNGKFYFNQLNSNTNLQIEFNPPALVGPKPKYMEEKYRCMNPAIVNITDKTNNSIIGYWYVQRTSNFDQTKGSNYECMESDNLVKTRNYLLKLDLEFNIINQWEIVDTVTKTHRPCHVTGIEDIRLYSVANNNDNGRDNSNDLYISGTTFYNHDYAQPKISWGKLKTPNQDQDIIELEYFNPILKPNPNMIEKNWSFVHYMQDEFMVIYRLLPLQVYKFKSSDPNNTWEQVNSPEHKFWSSYIRGSAGPIRYNQGWLTVGHEVIYDTNNNNITGRTYLHRFIWYDDLINCTQTKISSAFYLSDNFKEFNIEFCLGMALHHNAKSIILGAGINDRQAKLFVVDYTTIDKMLHDFNPEFY